MKASRAKLVQELRQQKTLGIRVLVIGILVVLTGIPFFIRDRRFNETAIRVPGKIVEMSEEKMGKDVSYFPVFSFIDRSGTSHTVRARLGSSHPRYEVGDAVEVLYPADDPDQARLNNFLMVWMWPIVFAGTGLILMIVGVLLWHGAVTAPVNELVGSTDEN